MSEIPILGQKPKQQKVLSLNDFAASAETLFAIGKGLEALRIQIMSKAPQNQGGIAVTSIVSKDFFDLMDQFLAVVSYSYQLTLATAITTTEAGAKMGVFKALCEKLIASPDSHDGSVQKEDAQKALDEVQKLSIVFATELAMALGIKKETAN